MTYVNVNITDDLEERKRRALLESERIYWMNEAQRLQAKIENIPRAIRQFGYVVISDGAEDLTLVAQTEKPETTLAESAERVTHAVLDTLRKGGDNLAVLEAVKGALA